MWSNFLKLIRFVNHIMESDKIVIEFNETKFLKFNENVGGWTFSK